MLINLTKNRDSLLEAWRAVLNDQVDINWALFGYEGQTDTLKVIGTGSQGIEELIEDLNSGKIMYAFVKVIDPKTLLSKYVLINWQGEGANTIRKGICANHLRDIESFFTGAHLTITARNEEEVEPDLIYNKISKCNSIYSFNPVKSNATELKTQVASNYTPINSSNSEVIIHNQNYSELKKEPVQEYIGNQAEHVRNNFEIDSLKKNTIIEKISIDIPPVKEFETLLAIGQKVHGNDIFDDNTKKVNHSDLLRQQRKKEAQDVISQRTFDARLIFEKTTTDQIKITPQKPIRSSISKTPIQQSLISVQHDLKNLALNIEEEDQTQIIYNEEQHSDDESNQFSTIKRSPRGTEKISEFVSVPLSQENHITDQQFVDELIYQEFKEGPGLQAKALYDYEAADDTEITFDPGDVITNIDQVDEGWWQGLAPDGSYGLFPANYVELFK